MKTLSIDELKRLVSNTSLGLYEYQIIADQASLIPAPPGMDAKDWYLRVFAGMIETVVIRKILARLKEVPSNPAESAFFSSSSAMEALQREAQQRGEYD